MRSNYDKFLEKLSAESDLRDFGNAIIRGLNDTLDEAEVTFGDAVQSNEYEVLTFEDTEAIYDAIKNGCARVIYGEVNKVIDLIKKRRKELDDCADEYPFKGLSVPLDKVIEEYRKLEKEFLEATDKDIKQCILAHIQELKQNTIEEAFERAHPEKFGGE